MVAFNGLTLRAMSQCVALIITRPTWNLWCHQGPFGWCVTAPRGDWQTPKWEWKWHPFSVSLWWQCMQQQNAPLTFCHLNCCFLGTLYILQIVIPIKMYLLLLMLSVPLSFLLLSFLCILFIFLSSLLLSLPFLVFHIFPFPFVPFLPIFSFPFLSFSSPPAHSSHNHSQLEFLIWVHPKRPCGCIIHSHNSPQNRLIIL